MPADCACGDEREGCVRLRGVRGTLGRRLLRQKPLPKTHPKTSLWLGSVGRLIEKESGFHGCEQARPGGLRSLFLRASRARTAQPSGPADNVDCYRLRGTAVFPAGKTSGRSNALCGALHLIRHGGAVTPSPQGEGFFLYVFPKRLPLEGKLSPERRLMRCSQPQLALSLFRAAARNPLVFSAEKTATPTHKTPKRQSAELRSAGLRSKLKKGPGSRGRACSHAGFQTLFHTDCRDKGNGQLTQRLVLWYFLDSRKYRSPLVPFVPSLTLSSCPKAPQP